MTGEGSWIKENYKDGWRKRGRENEQGEQTAALRWYPYSGAQGADYVTHSHHATRERPLYGV